MDQDLLAYLDRRFESIGQRFESIDQRFESMDRRFESIDQRFESMDQRLESMDQRLESMDQRLESMDQRLGGVERGIQETRVVVEGLHDQIKLLAEGMIGLEDRIQSFRADVTLEFAEVQKSIAPYYTYLDSRVRHLEARAERENQAPLDIIRKLYSKTG